MPDRAHYELPGGWYGSIEAVGEFAYEDAILRALPEKPTRDNSVRAQLPVELVPEPDNPHDRRAVSVRARGRVVGYLPRDQAADYHLPVKRIVASGGTVRTTADFYAYLDYSGSLEASIYVRVPGAEWLTPLNSGYPVTTTVLPHGRQTYQVTKEDQHFDHLFNYVPASGTGPVILTLHKVESALRNGNVRRIVEVRLNGERVGELTAATSAHYLPVIEHADAMGRVVGVWGTIKGSGLAAELTIKGSKSSELSDEWLREMPLFLRLVPEAHSYKVPDAYQAEPERPARKRARGRWADEADEVDEPEDDWGEDDDALDKDAWPDNEATEEDLLENDWRGPTRTADKPDPPLPQGAGSTAASDVGPGWEPAPQPAAVRPYPDVPPRPWAPPPSTHTELPQYGAAATGPDAGPLPVVSPSPRGFAAVRDGWPTDYRGTGPEQRSIGKTLVAWAVLVGFLFVGLLLANIKTVGPLLMLTVWAFAVWKFRKDLRAAKASRSDADKGPLDAPTRR